MNPFVYKTGADPFTPSKMLINCPVIRAKFNLLFLIVCLHRLILIKTHTL